jgi:hypothetical protein
VERFDAVNPQRGHERLVADARRRPSLLTAVVLDDRLRRWTSETLR